MDQGMSLEQYREAKQSGVDLFAEPAQEVREDAVPIEQEEIHDEPVDEPQDDPQDDVQDTNEPEAEVEADQIPQEQQSAWKKRAERERKKGAEEAETRLKAEYEAKINPLQKFFDQLGTTPEQAMQAIEQNKIKQEAEQLAYTNGWDETQTQWYVQQQQNQKEMRDLRVSVQINELAERSDLPGIKQMKPQISEYISRNPGATPLESYYAVGGPNLLQQIKRELEQKGIAKRQQTKRTVVSDAPATMTGPAPLPPEAIAFMKREGMSEAQVRELMRDDFPKDLTTFRKQKNRR